MSALDTNPRISTHRGLVPLAALAVLVAVAVIMLISARSATGNDPGDIKAAVLDAITVENELTMLPPGVRPGLFSTADRQSVRDHVRTEFLARFGGTALTSRLNAVLAWSDRIATDATEARTLDFTITGMQMDPPAMVATAATVSGTYVMVEKQGFDNADGTTTTFGGMYTNAFTFQLERRGQDWIVTAFTEQPVDFVPDPSMQSNLDRVPVPRATKNVPASYIPDPVNPAVP